MMSSETLDDNNIVLRSDIARLPFSLLGDLWIGVDRTESGSTQHRRRRQLPRHSLQCRWALAVWKLKWRNITAAAVAAAPDCTSKTIDCYMNNCAAEERREEENIECALCFLPGG